MKIQAKIQEYVNKPKVEKNNQLNPQSDSLHMYLSLIWEILIKTLIRKPRELQKVR